MRIDRLVAAEVAALSRSRAKTLIEAGEVSLDGVAVCDPAHIVRPGAQASGPTPKERSMRRGPSYHWRQRLT